MNLFWIDVHFIAQFLRKNISCINVHNWVITSTQTYTDLKTRKHNRSVLQMYFYFSEFRVIVQIS